MNHLPILPVLVPLATAIVLPLRMTTKSDRHAYQVDEP